jgi:opacity protein-like surface antigen
MKTAHKIQNVLLAVLMATAVSAPALASDPMPEMQPVQNGNVTFITGGVGIDQRKALESEAGSYNLRITNANRRGQLTTDDTLDIRSSNGHDVISVSGTDPLFYAKLPPGSYTVDARSGNEHKEQKVTISANKPTSLELVW